MNETYLELDDDQRAAVTDMSPEVLVVAGPGSGKTRVLVARIHHLIDNGARPSSICCVTFTNAGAEEIQRRVGDIRLGYIGTLHGLCLRMVREHADMFGLTARVSVVAEDLLEEIAETKRKELGLRLTKEQVKAACVWTGDAHQPLGILANTIRNELASNDLVTFDTLLFHGLECANFYDDEGSFEHILVDEFQDSSLTDYAIYSEMKARTKFFCGDPDQAIYSFRGGDVGCMLELSNLSSIHRLETNYRSRVLICEAATRLIANNSCRIDKETKSADVHYGEVRVKACETQVAELMAITLASQAASENGCDCAVLCRTRHIADQVSESLAAQGIQVSTRNQVRLPDGYRAMVELIAFACNPENDLLAKRALKIVIPDENLAKKMAMQAATSGTTINALHLLMSANPTLDETLQFVSRATSPSTAIIARQVCDLNPTTIKTPSDLLMAMRDPLTRKEGEGIYVGTIHSAKGREWGTVILPGWEQGSLPSDQADIEEERRLAFVAITRAKRNCIITWAKTRKPQWGPVEAKEPSQFIREAMGDHQALAAETVV